MVHTLRAGAAQQPRAIPASGRAYFEGKLDFYPHLKAAGGVARSQWKFDAADWLEEHGLIMEKPTLPLPPEKYLVGSTAR